MKYARSVTLCSVLFLVACTKKKVAPTCTAVLYGLHGTGKTGSLSFGKIDMSTFASSSLGSVHTMVSPRTTQGALNTFDSCYYIFEDNGDPYYYEHHNVQLYKITMAGVVSSYSLNGDTTLIREGLVYNPVTNKLYCMISHDVNVVSGWIAEVTLSGSSYFVTPVVMTAPSKTVDQAVSSTVDNSTGDMYFSYSEPSWGYFSSFNGNSDPPHYPLVKYRPGSDSSVTRISDNFGFGLQFNPKDKMLYCAGGGNVLRFTTEGKQDYDYRVNVPFTMYPGFLSSAFDKCSNTYVISTTDGVKRISMDGKVHTIPTTELYLGMAIMY